ncbi:MAG: L,D-transpeptidase family protein [Actinobacteria bacterium]|nr:L,D-transpeptidase family protein [Actinomycetota bacterium]
MNSQERGRKRGVGQLAAGVVAVVLVPVALAFGAGSSADQGASAARRSRPASGKLSAGGATLTLPDPVKPAFTPGRARPLAHRSHVSFWSPVRIATQARSKPSLHAAVVARLRTRTPEGTTNLVTVLGRREIPGGGVWAKVRLPVLPNGATGWVPRSALGGYGSVPTHLYVDLDRLTVELERKGQTVFNAPIGAGTASAPTPTGEFYIRNKLTSYRSPMYGPVAFGTSARSTTLTDWPAGGFIGIHGTDQPELLPGYVSHGCIRLENSDILRLARIMPVGTPVTIR